MRREGEERRGGRKGERKGGKKRVRRAHYTNSMARRRTRQSSHEKINLLMVQNVIGRSGTPSLMELLSGKPGESLLWEGEVRRSPKG